MNNNIILPQSQDTLEEMFEPEQNIAYGIGKKLPMSMQVGKTKEKVWCGWHYNYRRDYWHAIWRKLASYKGWNVDKARSNFYKWCKEKHLPSNIDFPTEFDRYFDISTINTHRTSEYIVNEKKIICKAPLTEREKEKIHKKYYNNVGRKFKGYRINPKLLRHQEMVNVLCNVYGGKIFPALEGEYLDETTVETLSKKDNWKVKEKFRELYGIKSIWNPQTRQYDDIHGKYWKPGMPRYGETLDDIFEAVWTPDIWEKKSKKQLKEERKHNMTMYARNKYRPKASKKARRAHFEQVYNDAIEKAKGVAARSEEENLVTIERLGFTKDSFKKFGGQPNLTK